MTYMKKKKTIARRCERCGKIFFTSDVRRKYCGKMCRSEAKQDKYELKGQPCWKCSKYCKGCSWSEGFIPVDGWIAQPTLIKNKKGEIENRSYDIIFCPQFQEG